MMNRRWMAILFVVVHISFLLAGCSVTGPLFGGNTNSNMMQNHAQNPAADMVPVKIYFASHDAQLVEAEIHMIKNDARLMQQAMQLLVNGPENTDLWAVVPAATKVKSVIVKDRTASVDFSDTLVTKGLGGSSREILAVGAIVNTLTEFPEVDTVQILVEGKKVSSLFGHLDISGPLGRSPEIIKTK